MKSMGSCRLFCRGIDGYPAAPGAYTCKLVDGAVLDMAFDDESRGCHGKYGLSGFIDYQFASAVGT